jgi:endonuclease/exonuclease/phosphatase (EEP) superfamily protein YafD
VKRGLAVVGAVTMAVALLPFAAKLAWVFDLFTHFRIQIVTALVALIVTFAFRRAYRWCAALGVCAAINAAVAVFTPRRHEYRNRAYVEPPRGQRPVSQ